MVNDDSESNGRSNRREHSRYDTSISVDYGTSAEDFLFSYINNISEMGIFITSKKPHPIGTDLILRFASKDPSEDVLELQGTVVWVNAWREKGDNPNPGMGVRFGEVAEPKRQQLVKLVKAIAYLHDEAKTMS